MLSHFIGQTADGGIDIVISRFFKMPNFVNVGQTVDDI